MSSAIKVEIRVKSEIKYVEMPLEQTLLHTKGLLNIKDETYYLRYEEEMEGIGPVHHTIKIKGDEALILRKGSVSMRQPLKIGEALEGTYQSPIGMMQTCTKMNQCGADWKASKGTGYLTLGYHLDLQGQAVGQFKLTFKLREAKS